MINYHKWTLEELKIEALKYQRKTDFKKGNSKAYDSICRRGIIDEMCSHMKKSRSKYSFEMLRDEALKYKTRNEFQEENRKYYMASQYLGIHDIICSHMVQKRGFDKDKKSLLYYIKVSGLYKIGVTNHSVKDRYRKEAVRDIIIIKQWEYSIGREALEVEKLILEENKKYLYSGKKIFSETGNSEVFTHDVLGLDYGKL